MEDSYSFNGHEIISFKTKELLLGDYVRFFEELAKTNGQSTLSFEEIEIQNSVVLIDKDNREVSLTQKNMNLLPVRLYLEIKEKLNSLNTNEKAGELLSKGNAIEEAAFYRLGVPVKIENGELLEISLLAKTYSNIRGIVAMNNPFSNIHKLICQAGTGTIKTKDGMKDIKPFPSSLADKISIIDAVFLMDNILPNFLPQPKSLETQ